MAPAESVDSVMQGAEAYFEQHRVRPILAQALKQLALTQPPDPIAALQQMLASAGQVVGSHIPLHVDSQVEAPHEYDVDTPPEEGYDALKILTLERLPGRKGSDGQPIVDLSTSLQWAGGFNRPLLEGWLPQPSPCCAAASTAGAFNALWNFGRDSKESASIREVAELMALNCERLCKQRQQRIERLLGLQESALDQVLAELDAQLLAQGLEWTVHSGPKAVTRSSAMDALRGLLRAAPLPAAASSSEASGEPSLDTPFSADPIAALQEALGVTSTESGSNERDEGEEAARGGVLVQCPIDWDQEFGELFAKRKGVRRLRAEKPNTGEIGSWGIKQAMEDLIAARNCDPVRVHTLLGRKSNLKVEVPVEKSDDSASIDRQWNALKAAFSKPHSVMLFHLTNHYALLYAWREWQDADGQFQRQILTARQGQKPTAWIMFEEARDIMMGWSGYHILQLQRITDKNASPGVQHACKGA